MRFVIVIINTALLAMLMPCFSYGQSKKTDQVAMIFTDTRVNIDSLEKSVKINPSLGSARRAALLGAVNEAKRLVDYESLEISKLSGNKQIESQVVTKYILEARNMNLVLRDAYRSNNIDKIDTVLQFINADLKSKLFDAAKNVFPDGHGRDCPPMCDNGTNAKRSYSVQVTVKVIAKKNGKSLIGYNVFAKPQYSLDITLVDAFNPTDKATLGIVPGMKLIWIESGNKIIQQRPVNVSSANPKMEVDFYIE